MVLLDTVPGTLFLKTLDSNRYLAIPVDLLESVPGTDGLESVPGTAGSPSRTPKGQRLQHPRWGCRWRPSTDTAKKTLAKEGTNPSCEKATLIINYEKEPSKPVLGLSPQGS